MSKTVIALFDNQAQSQKAVQELVKAGISRDRVDISEGHMPKSQVEGSRADDKDSISAFFDSLFGSDNDDSKRYSEVARTCGSIVTVHTQSAEEARKAAEVLDNAGAEDIDDLARKCGSATAAHHAASAKTGTQQTTASAAGTTIPIIKEDVQIGKREVETGGVRVRSRIVERPVQENLRLREEHVRVERRPVNRPATEADMRNFKEGQADFVERKEVPIVNKETKVVEEVRIGKEVEQHQQTVRETEKKTEVEIEKLNRTPGSHDKR